MVLLGPVRVAVDGERVLDGFGDRLAPQEPGRSQAPTSRSAARARSTTAAPGPASRSSIGYRSRSTSTAQLIVATQSIVVIGAA